MKNIGNNDMGTALPVLLTFLIFSKQSYKHHNPGAFSEMHHKSKESSSRQRWDMEGQKWKLEGWGMEMCWGWGERRGTWRGAESSLGFGIRCSKFHSQSCPEPRGDPNEATLPPHPECSPTPLGLVTANLKGQKPQVSHTYASNTKQLGWRGRGLRRTTERKRPKFCRNLLFQVACGQDHGAAHRILQRQELKIMVRTASGPDFCEWKGKFVHPHSQQWSWLTILWGKATKQAIQIEDTWSHMKNKKGWMCILTYAEKKIWKNITSKLSTVTWRGDYGGFYWIYLFDYYTISICGLCNTNTWMSTSVFEGNPCGEHALRHR